MSGRTPFRDLEHKPGVEPREDVEALRAWTKRMRESDEWPDTDIALMDALDRVLARLEQVERALLAAEQAVRWISDNHPKVIREMPTPLFRALASTEGEER